MKIKEQVLSLLAVAALLCALPSCNKDSVSNSEQDNPPSPCPFKTILEKSDDEIQGKLDELWNHYFEGGANAKVYFENDGEAYIKDIYNNDVRSFGQSFGMMICVQTNHKEQFDKLWKFAKNHMLYTSGSNTGHFAWQLKEDGTVQDSTNEPGADIYFAASLLFAGRRWGNDGENNYEASAQEVMQNMFSTTCPSFSPEYHIYFQAGNMILAYTVTSYNLPAFLDLFAQRSGNNDFAKAAAFARDHLYNASNATSGLFPDYSSFNGLPYSSSKYKTEGPLCAMNFGMDFYLTGKDKQRQKVMAERLISHFNNDKYTHSCFDWDGSNPSDIYYLRQAGTNAVACFALMDDEEYEDVVKLNLGKAWDAKPMTGSYRTYDGLVHYMSMLHLCGSFRLW